MKKLLSMLLVLAMLCTLLAGCAKEDGNATGGQGGKDKPALTGTMQEIMDKIYEELTLDIAVGSMPVDLSDTSETGVWALQNYTGLSDASEISDVAVSEAMIGSIAYSLVLVRVKDAGNAKTVAQKMKSGINPRKWLCVEADDIQVSGYGDVVMFIMVYHELDVTAQQHTDAFQKVCGGALDFTI